MDGDMVINIKYNIGDVFYSPRNREAYSDKVMCIRYGHTCISMPRESNLKLIYVGRDRGVQDSSYTYEEHKMYPTKEACNLAIIEEIAGETR